MVQSKFKFSNDFILLVNANERVLLPIKNVAEIRETQNGVIIKTTTHDDDFSIQTSFNTIAISLGLYDD